MVKIQTLNEISRLADSPFNQPPPRHGIRLLYWFAKQYQHLHPKSEEYGFHRFYNRIDDDDDERLLANQTLTYYEVGNLNARGADKLPSYVKPNPNQKYHKESNKDRIIVGLDEGGRINRVYVTEHEDPRTFDITRTYRVSLGLLDQISCMGLEEFLNKMKKNHLFITQQANFTHSQAYTSEQSDNSGSWCTIL